jgi:hypothetical protein
MAIRSSAGSGVVISLIVFVLLTILLLAGSILLWGELEAAKKKAVAAEQHLEKFATKAERSKADWLAPLEDARGRNSILGFLHNENRSLQEFAVGSPDGPIGDLAAARERWSLQPGQSLADGLDEVRRQAGEMAARIAAMESTAAAVQASKEDLDGKLRNAIADLDQLIADESTQLKGYTDADAKYAAAIKKAIAEFESTQANLRDQNRSAIAQKQDEVSELTADNKRLAGQKRILEERLNRDKLRAADPATLADGYILDVVGNGDHVYIDRGRNDRVVLGMTFEVYTDPAQIRPNEDGIIPRGLASIQVVKIGDASSTAKVTRRTKGRPIVASNVIANAVYDPEYTFKFLVHGVYDLDHDGNATEQEAEYLRERIERWGGVVVKGDEIPGDLDFLVLGDEPREPNQKAKGKSTQEMTEYKNQLRTYDRYQSLKKDAEQADIPWLNQNRLEILTGRTDL